MKNNNLDSYLNIRRMGWPYEGTYRVECKGNHRFVAMIDGEIAGLSYAEITKGGSEAMMKMNLKSEYAEYGIGTELLHLLMNDLRDSGVEIIRFNLSAERYAFQIYNSLGFKIEKQDEKTIYLVSKATNLNKNDW